MKFKLFNFNNEKLPRATRKMLSPSRKFKEKAKGRFLVAFDARHPAPTAHLAMAWFAFVMKTTAVTLAVATVLLGGASVYADTKNVPADNPLYPLKRLGESVQLAVITVGRSTGQGAELQATFATRRADEIADLEERHPTSTLLPRLANDFGIAVTASIDDVEKTEAPKHPVAAQDAAPQSAATRTQTLGSEDAQAGQNKEEEGSSNRNDENQQSVIKACDTIKAFFGASSSVIQEELLGRKRILQRFNANCRTNTDNNSSGNIQKSSTTLDLSTTSTIVATGTMKATDKDNHDGEGDQRNRQGAVEQLLQGTGFVKIVQ
jgi:hypothetical protein